MWNGWTITTGQHGLGREISTEYGPNGDDALQQDVVSVVLNFTEHISISLET